ncbi:MAG TPA: glycoside hydrolase family 44 protein, partial [Polyangiaceae bacterium]|nr:glycoside hydrolase family 44 protein [Polyangiaceae bacterium]
DCYGGMGPSTGVNTNHLDFVSTDAGSAAFLPNAASKPGAFCACAPAQPCDGGCAVSTSPVYQDEFVNYIKTHYGSGGAPVFFELDNEPNYWGGVHPELWPFTGTLPCQSSSVTYDDIVSRDTQFAAAAKKAWPSTKVFGPVVAQDGIIYAHSYENDVHWPIEFLDYYLGEMAKASGSAGTALLDVLDLHYYNYRGSTPSQCVQNPRMFWDPNYTAASASTTDGIDFAYSGVSNNYFDTAWYPRRLIPRLLDKIAMAYPPGGPQAPGLAFSEYNSGCEDVIAGAITEADDLGVFGREGVFAAAASPVQSLANNYLVAAFDLYRNYDGNGAVVGDTSVSATTNDIDDTSVYAFAHSGDASAVDVVAINKTSSAVPVNVAIASAPQLSTATMYNIVNGSAAVVPAGTPPPVVTCTSGLCTLAYTMPPLSATTMVLRAAKD